MSTLPIQIFLFVPAKCFFSHDISFWGNLGDFFAGSIGIVLTFLSVRYMYLTFREQRKSKIESEFQQSITNYYSLINLIHENWLHRTPPSYLNGREIFGNAVLAIDMIHRTDLPSEKRCGSFEKGFISIYQKHINVFEHYCEYIQGVFGYIIDNKDLNDAKKEQYLTRFLSIISSYEFIFFSYYNIYLSTDNNKLNIRAMLYRKALKFNGQKINETHQEQKNFIVAELIKHKY